MTSLATTKREAVAAAIRTAVEELEGTWSTYGSPVDVYSLPAVVIGPGDPYREQSTFGNFGENRETLRLIAHVFINRASGNTALDIFDVAADAIMEAVDGVSYSTRWADVTLSGVVTVGETEALGAAIQIEVL